MTVASVNSATRIYWDAVLFECVLTLLGIQQERKMDDDQVLAGLEEIRTANCWNV